MGHPATRRRLCHLDVLIANGAPLDRAVNLAGCWNLAACAANSSLPEPTRRRGPG